MANEMFDGFQHEQYRDEVEERWGKDAWKRSDDWWTTMGHDQRRAWQDELSSLNTGWQQAADQGVLPESDTAQALAARHVEWLRGMPQPMLDAGFKAYVAGLGETYVNDPRFAAKYGGKEGAMLVRDALDIYVGVNNQASSIYFRRENKHPVS